MKRWYVALFFAAACAVAPRVHAQIATTGSGVVVFEAEAATTNTPRGAHAWVFTNDLPTFSGTGFMHALPDINSNIQVNVAGTSPELVYPIAFNQSGTYRIWMRGYVTGGNDDSCHYGLNGATSSAWNLNLASNAWRWTNLNVSGGTAVMTVPSAATHTFHLWMREDGIRLDRIALVTDVNFKAIAGNSFHLPVNSEPAIATMRSPASEIFSNTAVVIYNGNQFQGSGNPGNQLQTGSTIFHKHATSAVWSAVAMTFFQENGNNKYFSGTIPGGTYQAGDVVQYYLRIPYSDHLPTFLYGNDSASFESEFESVAQADPFAYTVQAPLAPDGGYLAITNTTASGDVEARVYTNHGHVAVVGPDLAGTPLANAIHFAPPRARVNGEIHPLGAVLAHTVVSNGLELSQRLGTNTVTTRLTFLEDGIARFEVVHWDGLDVSRTFVSAPSDAGEHFYGFGEKFNDFDQAGRNVKMITDDPAGAKGDRSYKVVPWFVSTRGYGFHLDSSALSYFDMRASAADRYTISNLFGTLKFNVVYGPRLPDVLTRFTGYTGRPQLSPPWAFAPWMSTDHWRDGGEIRYMVTRYRERGLAGSVVVFDSPWETAYNDFTWNTQQFADSGNYDGTNWPGFASSLDMMNFLRTNGFKVICWMTPFVNTNSLQDEPGITNGYASNYAEGSNLGYFVRSSPGGSPLVVNWWKGRGSPVDFTNPGAVQWLQGQLSNLVAASGGAIGGFKTDDGESGNPPGSYIPSTASYFDGRTGEEMQNAYATEYHKTVWNVLGTNGLLFARSGFTGSQAYPGYWAGDNEPNFGDANGLPSVIVAAQSAAMCGYSTWASDIGGYQNSNLSSTPTNLFMRWTQFGAFSPLMQMHRQVGANTQYPWSYGSIGVTNYHYYTRLHTALFPYLYTYAHEASTNGLPIMRPLVLMDQTNTAIYGIKHTYLFGNELLVAAMITNNQSVRNVYMPAGQWYDLWNNARYDGGQNIVWTNVDQAKYPVFVRKGAILPMISSNVVTLVDSAYMGHTNIATWDGALEFLVYPDTQSTFRVYDGTLAECLSNDTVVTFNLASTARPVSFRIFGPAPASVERDGVRLPAFTDAAQYNAAPLGWRHDAAAGFTFVKLPHGGGATQLRMGPDTVGDGIPNSWRQLYFGSATSTDSISCASCDADGDGVSNLEEYRAGTEPGNSNSYLRVSAAGLQPVSGTNNAVVSWLSRPGIPYGIGWKSDLADTAPWQAISATYTGDGAVLNWFDDGAQTGGAPSLSPTNQRYYRLIVP